MIRWTLTRALPALLLATLAILAGGLGWLHTESGGRWLADRIEVAVFGPGRDLQIGHLRLAMAFAPQLTDLRLADADGVWLTIDQARARLAPLALLHGQLRIEVVEVGRIALLRQPVPAMTTDATDPPDWPVLPIGIAIEHLEIAEVVVDASLAGTELGLGVAGAARLGAGQGLSLTLSATPTEGQGGALEALVVYLPATRQLKTVLHLRALEPLLLAALTGWTAPAPIDATLSGAGDLDDWSGDLRIDAGADMELTADIVLAAADDGRRLTLDVAAHLGALVDQPLRPLLDGETSLDASILVEPDGKPRLDRVVLTGGFGMAAASGRVDPEGETTRLSLTLVPAEPGRFAALTPGISWRAPALSALLTGSLQAPMLSGSLHAQRLSYGDLAVASPHLELDLRLDEPLSPTAARIGLSARLAAEAIDPGGLASLGEPRADLALSVEPDGGLDLERLRFELPGLALSASGKADADRLAIDWQADIADLMVIDPSLSGRLKATGTLGGPPADPSLQAGVELRDARPFGIEVPTVRLDADITRLVTRPGGDLALTGRIAGLPLDAAARVQVENDAGSVAIADLVIRLASLTATGALTLADATLDGVLSAHMGRLADLDPLSGASLTGALAAELSLSAPDGRQRADALLSLSRPGLTDLIEAEQMRLRIAATDLLAVPRIEAHLEAGRIRAGELTLEHGRMTATGELNGLRMTLGLTGEQLSARTQARLKLGADAAVIDITEAEAGYADIRTRLRGPARLRVGAGQLRIDGLVLEAEGARLTVDGRLGEAVDLALVLTDAPLTLARLVRPDIDLSGRLNGRLRLQGNRQAPQATAKLRAEGVALAALRKAALPALDIGATLDWQDGRLRLNARVDDLLGGPLRASASIAAPASAATGLPAIDPSAPLTGKVSGRLRLDGLNNALAARGDRIDGVVRVELALSGRIDAPRITGPVALTDGRFRSPLTGLVLDGLRLRLVGAGDRLMLEDLAAETPNGGRLRGEGRLDLAPGSGLPLALTLRLDDALLLDTDLVAVTTQGVLILAGSLNQGLSLDGGLTIVEADIQLPERLPPSIQALDVEEINLPAALAARRPPRGTGTSQTNPSLPIGLKLAIDAPGRVLVRGMGLDAEVAGQVRLAGPPDAIEASGGFALRRGHFDLPGRRLDLAEGVVTLPEDGSLDAAIRFLVRADLPDGSAWIEVAGRASAPRIQLGSEPELPEDEVLARIIFGRPANDLTTLQQLQLARAALQLASGEAGTGPLDRLAERLGTERIGLRQGADARDDVRLGLGGRISDRVAIDLEQGLQPGSGRASVELEVLPNVSVETELGVNNTGRVRVEREWEY